MRQVGLSKTATRQRQDMAVQSYWIRNGHIGMVGEQLPQLQSSQSRRKVEVGSESGEKLVRL